MLEEKNFKCFSCVYYPFNCNYLNTASSKDDTKVISILHRFMENSCKYYYSIKQLK
ncbi:hypothetical protein [Petroclostridium sp. X23]|uniref:hypothetical protein n=1 Tax=Petroclostridium sp. X23 TaxID=3045146 RepID=UPI0024ADED46|nr:hypothetical protein [Petroclostridium sp. X23]WHH57192.1 hypothetical protein QKW49_15245 [Petroclostridium sp. X23]